MTNFEEYKLFSERVQRLSERRQIASQTYLTVNTLIFGVFAFLVKDAGFRSGGLVLVSFPLFLVGVVACSIWGKIIVQFKEVIGWHYEQLREMEQSLPESNKIYTREWEKLFQPKGGKERFGFARLEIWLPYLFIGLYIIYGIGLLIGKVLGWI